MTRKIVIASQKGGVGKTTTAVNLANALARSSNNRVLVVDMDSQAETTLSLGVDKRMLSKSVFDLLTDPLQQAQELIHESIKGSLWLLPACSRLSMAEKALVNEIGRELILRKQLSYIEKNYDYIIIDCPPGVSLLSLNALFFGNEIVIPVQSQFYALEGSDQLFQLISDIRTRMDHTIRILGVVCTMYDKRTLLSNCVLQALQKLFGIYLFSTVVPINTKLAEAPLTYQSIFDYSPNDRAVKTFSQLAAEVEARSQQSNWVLESAYDNQDTASDEVKSLKAHNHNIATVKLEQLNKSINAINPVVAKTLSQDTVLWLKAASHDFKNTLKKHKKRKHKKAKKLAIANHKRSGTQSAPILH